MTILFPSAVRCHASAISFKGTSSISICNVYSLIHSHTCFRASGYPTMRYGDFLVAERMGEGEEETSQRVQQTMRESVPAY
jgi:hypothetical protein